ncbi:trifunctional serine/threonine-protein kinase/ATP-binding protein/sensor histidine kinase [Xanthobacter flavus]|uniref:trifunctional serine/threonine-protein kinase/ATP-binding protein/sensor histidine kinase n=1 Tax=Xanthobacter flavus TaxID=281 RepID=UPI0037288C3C
MDSVRDIDGNSPPLRSGMDAASFDRLALTSEGAVDGIESCLAQDELTGERWRVKSALRGSPAAAILDREAALAQGLPTDLADPPHRLEHRNRVLLLYPDRPTSTLGDLTPGTLAPEALLDLGTAIAAALSRLHALGTIHGGLRPPSVLLEERGRVRFRHLVGPIGTDAPQAAGFMAADAIAYAAPEQARLHRPASDARSDLYSLGVLLYALLVGRLPLQATSMAEWLHAHVAVEPVRPGAVRGDVPPMLDAILMKLIDKDPEQRYQSAEALQIDLRLARTALAAGDGAATFALGRGEFARKGIEARGLFGRTLELSQLVEAFGRVSRTGRSELILLRGEAGAGKSALVEQLSKAWLPADAQFAAGKSVLLQEGMPYAPFAQALRTLVMRALGESADVLDGIRERLAAQLSGYSSLLIDLVPEAEFILSDGGALPEVAASMAQARVVRIVLQTLKAFATPSRPLVLFLDDLQWMDAASLGALQALWREAPPHVLLIGSYREEEVARHPELVSLLAEAHTGLLPTTEIRVGPLSSTETLEFVASALNGAPAELGELADSIHRKTGGNAFFVRQLLQKLFDDRVIAFDPEAQRWRWDPLRFGAYNSVSDFMLQRLDALPPSQRGVLQRLASVGGRVSGETFAHLVGQSEAEAEHVADMLVEAGLLLRRDADYVIAHDRVLEAAYASIPEPDRPTEHLAIARRMIAVERDGDADWAFAMAAQIERADRTTLDEAERLSFVRALRTAARRARNSGAVHVAAGHIEMARSLMPDVWQVSHRALFAEVKWLHCEILIALGRIDEALPAIERSLAIAATPVEQADLYRLKAIARTIRSDYEGAIDEALAGLALLGVELERSVTDEQLAQAYQACSARLNALDVSHLRDLPEITDPAMRSALALLSALSAAFFVRGGLRVLHLIKIVELTLDHGMTPEAAYGFAWFGVFCAELYGAYEDGETYAMMAQDIVQRDGYEAQQTAVLLALDQVGAWTRPLRFALGRAREAAQIGLTAGDLGWACYARNHIASNMLMLGAPLSAVRDDIEEGLAWTRQFKYRDIELILAAQFSFVDTLASGDYDGAQGVPEAEITSLATLFWVRHYAGVTAFLFGDFERAVLQLEQAAALSWAAPAHIDTASCALFLALALARTSAGAPARKAALGRIDELRRRFADRARLNPSTFECKHLLLEAEAARLSGIPADAQRLYEQAADAAAASGFVHEQALAYELAAYCCREAGLGIPTSGYVQAAISHYRHWGAEGKAEQLMRSFPLLLDGGGGARAHRAGDGAADATGGPVGQGGLNLEVMTKAAQTLAETVGLDQVIRTLMREMIVHAGAQYGLLILMRGGDPVIEASARVENQQVEVDVHSAVPTARDLPLAMLNTVMRTRRTAVFADAASEEPGLRAAGHGGTPARSLLFMPLIKRGTLVGILYLENNLAADVFTPNRTALLELLATQAAISLDAARLYNDLVDENTRRASAEFDLRETRAELGRASRMMAMGNYAASIAHEINQPLTSIVASADAAMRWLRRAEPDVDEALQGVEQIRASGMRAAGIVKSLRALAKRTAPVLEPIRLEDLTEDVMRLVVKDLQSNGVELVDLLAVDRRHVEADPVQLQQVVFNLITNAIHAMEAVDPGRRRLTIETSQEAGTVRLSIADTGCGMSEDVLSRIFEPFFTTKHAGMGIGLSICRSIIEAHGGVLRARSTVGEGSVFYFSLKTLDDAARTEQDAEA